MNWSQLKWRQLNWSHSRTVVALSSQRGRGALRAPRSKLPSARASRAPNHSAHRVQHRCRRAGGVSLTAAPQPCARSHNCSRARRAPPRSNPGTICARRTQRRALLHARLRQSMPDSTSRELESLECADSYHVCARSQLLHHRRRGRYVIGCASLSPPRAAATPRWTGAYPCVHLAARVTPFQTV